MQPNSFIIYLNGPTSSGKSTLAKALQQAMPLPFLHVSLDKIIGWMPEKCNDWTSATKDSPPTGFSWKQSLDASGSSQQELQVGPLGKTITQTFQQVVLTLATMGHNLIIEDLSFGKTEVESWKVLLNSFNVLWVGVHAPLAVLEAREQERGNRIVGSARGQYDKVHVDVVYDLEIDTQHATLAENIHKIQTRSG